MVTGEPDAGQRRTRHYAARLAGVCARRWHPCGDGMQHDSHGGGLAGDFELAIDWRKGGTPVRSSTPHGTRGRSCIHLEIPAATCLRSARTRSVGYSLASARWRRSSASCAMAVSFASPRMRIKPEGAASSTEITPGATSRMTALHGSRLATSLLAV